MFSDEELFTRLHAQEMDESELQTIVSGHFGGASSASPNEVVFPGTADSSKVALRFRFKKGQLAAINAGPALEEAHVATLQNVIESELSPAPPRVGTQVLFASMPVAGTFRFRDDLQVLPAPSDAPTPPALIADHPFLLQFKYKPSQNVWLGTARRAAQARRLQLLLSALLEESIRSVNPFVEFHWVIPPITPGKPMTGAPRSMWCQEMYTFESLATLAECESFSDIAELRPLPLVDPVEYYTRRGIRSDQTLSVPANLGELLTRFFSASYDDQDRFIRASFWFDHARTAYLHSRSASFTSLISAIEALMPADQKLGDCPVCKRPLGKGATRRLNEFLDQYAPTDPKFQASRVALYWQFRSQLSHGGALSHLDRASFFHGLGGSHQEEQELLDEVRQLVKVVLVNWLHSRSSLLIPTKGRGTGFFAFGTINPWPRRTLAAASL
jgi:hypothetical protein